MAQEEERVKIIFDSNAKEATQQTNALGQSIDKSTDAVNDNTKAVDKQDEVYKSLKSQLREANQELVKSIQLYGETSTQAIEAAKGVAGLKDQIGQAKDLSEAFNPDQKMKALGAATQIAATGMQGVTAGMALFGDQSEDTQKMLLKVQAAMAFSDAISGLSDLGDKWSVFKSVVSDTYAKILVARKSDIVATEGQTVAQIILNNVAKANPYILLASLIGAVSIATYAYISATKEAEKQISDTTAAVNTNKNATDNLTKSINENKTATEGYNSIEIARARALGASDTQIQKLIQSQKELAISTGLQNASDAYKNLTAAQDNLAKALKTNNEDLIKSARDARDEAKSLYEKANEDANSALIDESVNRLTVQAETHQKEADARAKAEEKRRQSEEENKKKKLEQAKKDADDFAAFQKTVADAEIEATIKKNTDEAENTKRQQDEITALSDKNYADEQTQKEKDDKAAADKLQGKKDLHNAELALGESAISAAKDLFGKNKAVQKTAILAEGGVALGKLAVSTVEAVGKDNAASPLTFGLPWSGIHVGMGVVGAASIISNTNKQLQSLGGGGSLNAGSSGGGAVTPQAAPQVAFNNTAENQIGQSISKSQSSSPPIKVVVSESDISTAQGNVKALVTKNSFP